MRLAFAAAGPIVLLGMAALWLERKPIAAGFVDRTLAARGVEGSYRIVELGVARQRLENLRLGNPRSPDLVADEVELWLAYGLHGPRIRAVTARGVRLRGRLVDGRISLGALDRLLPKSSGGAFALPDVDVTLADARMGLTTPAGTIRLALAGDGNLAGGFRGTLAAAAPAIATANCRLSKVSARINIAVSDRRPVLDGPARIGAAACGGMELTDARAELDARIGDALDRWLGSARIAVGAIAANASRVAEVRGQIGFSGDIRRTAGQLHLISGALRSATIGAGSARIDGSYAVADGATFAGRLSLGHVAVDRRRAIATTAPFAAADGTPLAPLGRALASALLAAASDSHLSAGIRATPSAVTLSDAVAVSASGGRAAFGGGATYYLSSGAVRIDGVAALTGGGLPTARIVLRQPQPGGAMTGEARVASYAAGGARIVLAPVGFSLADGAVRLATRATLDGPVAGGRVTGLSLPLDLRAAASGGLTLNPACTPLTFAALDLAGAHFDAARLAICPVAAALVARSGGRIGGGGRIVALRLTGRSGDAPLAVGADALRFDLTAGGFVVDALNVRLGPAERQTRLDIARLTGGLGARGIAGEFADAAGQIGAIPLRVSQGGGRWQLSGPVLAIVGDAKVADAATAARFQPLAANGIRLRLENGHIAATATLREPKGGAQVALVALRHDLGNGRGGATLDVPKLEFGDNLQPEALTRLTLGVIADVKGAVSGRGEIKWDAQGVTSTGRFATSGIDLAAAFGPVAGIKGEIVFSDLLGLETPPGQTATIAEINPGVVVADGVVHYRLLPGQRVAVEARWPFSGGALLLRPTVMDFGQTSARHLTFEVAGLDAARFIQQLEFQNIAATGVFDGTVPMIFDDKGGHIVGGRLVARAGGGTVAYVGEITKAQLGTFGKLAFDALKSIRYQALSIDLDGALDGEIVSRVLFNGVNQQPLGGDTPFARELKGLPFKFNITIRAPFRGLIGSARSLNDPGAFIQGYLPAAATPPIQPSESDKQP